MKAFLLFLLLAASLSLFSQNYNIVLRDTVMFPGQSLANIWGFKKGGREYALVGASQGLIIVDVTDPANCYRVGNQLTDGINSLWREVRTYGNYAYITSEGLTGSSTGGLGIVDLSGLPATPPTSVTKYYGDGLMNNRTQRVHALQVDTVSAKLYLYGGRTGNGNWVSNGGAVRFNISTPASPVFLDSAYHTNFNKSYVHDGYAHNDTLYAGHIYDGAFAIYKFDNTAPYTTPPVEISRISTPLAFTHNTWPSANRKYLFTTDEKQNSYLASFDINDPTNPVQKDIIRTGTSGAIVHNTHVKGNHAISAYYEDGVTITDISRPANLVQTGRYDTYVTPPFPVDGSHFVGAWGAYPYLPSGNLLITNMSENKVLSNVDTGVLYILTPTYVSACYLEGEVRDASTNLVLSGVTVAIQHTDPLNSGTTGTTGLYATGQPTAGTFNVVYSKTGYVSQTVSVTLANGSVSAPATVYLSLASLPIELKEFSAKPDGRANLVQWVTASEAGTERFEVLVKQEENAEWKVLGTVEAAGESLSELRYELRDEAPAVLSYYQLRTLDLDGREHLSEVVSVERPIERLSIANVYPVPSTGILTLEARAGNPFLAELSIGNYSGETLLQQKVELLSGLNRLNLQLPNDWPSGNYWVRISDETSEGLGTFVLRR